MVRSIILVDSDQAFATILKEGLEATGDYEVTLADTGNEALELITDDSFDMAIVDLGLEDVSPPALVREIRDAVPSIRIMLIPLTGEEVPDELKGVEIQGLLPKPFFVDDLPAIVKQAMTLGDEVTPTSATSDSGESTTSTTVSPKPDVAARAAEESASERTSADSPRTPSTGGSSVGELAIASQDIGRWWSQEKQITQVLRSLNREMRAEAIIVSMGEELIAFVGSISLEQAGELAGLVAESARAAGRAAGFLGEPEGRFEQSLHEGAQYRLYSLRLSGGVALSLALSSDIPLGTLRYRTRQAADELLSLLA